MIVRYSSISSFKKTIAWQSCQFIDSTIQQTSISAVTLTPKKYKQTPANTKKKQKKSHKPWLLLTSTWWPWLKNSLMFFTRSQKQQIQIENNADNGLAERPCATRYVNFRPQNTMMHCLVDIWWQQVAALPTGVVGSGGGW